MSIPDTRASSPAGKPHRHSPKRGLRVMLVLLRRIRAHFALTRLDEHLLYDLGIDPLDVHDAIRDQRFRSSLPRLARQALDRSR